MESDISGKCLKISYELDFFDFFNEFFCIKILKLILINFKDCFFKLLKLNFLIKNFVKIIKNSKSATSKTLEKLKNLNKN